MANIKLLDDELINKIAAGEVIERPASVVKELVENSIDSGADQIIVELREAGKSLIKVIDNGSGMNEEDALLCVKRHSTSKIASDADLFSIETLGFRGEALASIAAVSNLTLVTKQKDALEGIGVIIEGGEVIKKDKIGCAAGTVIEVRNLFFNTPARKKYMKTMSTELSQITDIITRYALANPSIGFKLIHNDNTIVNSPKTADTLGNITSVYGSGVSKSLVAVDFSKDDIEVKGYVSKPELSKADKSYQSIFVNNRYVKNKIISSAVYDAYHTMLNVGKHPVVVLNVMIKPEKIDVNVHPTKSEIRVHKEDELFHAVYEAVKSAFDKEQLIPSVEVEHSFDFKEKKYGLVKDKQVTLDVDEGIQVKIDPITVHEEDKVEIQPIVVEESKIPEMVILGQMNKTYILADSESGLMIIDQHAAEERVNYETFMGQGNDVQVQELLNPEVVDVDPKNSIVLDENLDVFKKIGFEVENFGDNSFIVRTVPEILGKVQTKELLLKLVSVLKDAGKETDKIREEKLIRAACRASVKAGAELTLVQMKSLVQELNRCKQPFTCPHGRPTVINITINELEKKFKRIM